MNNFWDEKLVKKELGKFIKEIRKSEKKSLSKVAERLEVSEATLRHWEYGDRKMPEKYAIQYIEIFNLDKKRRTKLQSYYLDKKIIEKEYVRLTDFYFEITVKYSTILFKYIERYLKETNVSFEEMYIKILKKMNCVPKDKQEEKKIEEFYIYICNFFISTLFKESEKEVPRLGEQKKSKEKNKKEVAEIIEDKRREKGMTLEYVAQKLKISVASMSNYESTKEEDGRSKKISKDKLEDIIELYDMNLEETARLMQKYFEEGIMNPIDWANEMALLKMEKLMSDKIYDLQNWVMGIESLKKSLIIGKEIINFCWLMNWKVSFLYTEKKKGELRYKGFLEVIKNARGGIAEPRYIRIEGDDGILTCKWEGFVRTCKRLEKEILDYIKNNYDSMK